MILIVEKLWEHFKKKSCKIKKKRDKLYVKWGGYDNSFNRWIEKKKTS